MSHTRDGKEIRQHAQMACAYKHMHALGMLKIIDHPLPVGIGMSLKYVQGVSERSSLYDHLQYVGA